MNNDVIIIGGGLGGLFTGAILAKEGLAVTVLEKNATPGGGLQSFVRWGEVFDTGMHVVGGLHPQGNIYKICQYLGIANRLQVHNLDCNSQDTIYVEEDNMTYCVRSNRADFVDSLANYFPKMKEGLQNYVEAIFKIVEEMHLFHLKPSDTFVVHSNEYTMPADKFVAKYVSDRKLCRLLKYLATLYGGVDGVTPAYVHAVVTVLYLTGHGMLIGGSQHMADLLVNCIENYGGKVVCNAEVQTLQTNDKKIASVVTTDGKMWEARHFISSIDPNRLIEKLDNPYLFTRAYRTRVKMLPNTCSAFMLSIKFKPESFPFLNNIGYYINSYQTPVEWPTQFICLTPPVQGQGLYAHTMNITVPTSFCMVNAWCDSSNPGQRGSDYQEWKKRMADKILSKMNKIYPGFATLIDKMDIATPLTFRDYHGDMNGSMFGFQKNCNNILQTYLSPSTRIPNLFLTGQNVNLHGICGVPLTAIITSESILGKNSVLKHIQECAD